MYIRTKYDYEIVVHNEKSERSAENLIERPTSALSVECVGPSELDVVARVLAEAYSDLVLVVQPTQRYLLPLVGLRDRH